MASDHNVDELPLWAWVAPVAAAVLLVLKFSHVIPADSGLVLVLAAILLGGAVFAAVHHAEIIALRVGEPFGSIVLAVAVTVIEVALIVSILMGATAGSEFLARDTVFATVMIVLNGIVGLCLVVGGMRHHEQSFQTAASSTALSVLGTLGDVHARPAELYAGNTWSDVQHRPARLRERVLCDALRRVPICPDDPPPRLFSG